MAKRLIQIDDKYYKLDNSKFRKLISYGQSEGPDARIKKLVTEIGIESQEQTVKGWYYGNKGTQDIETLKKITTFYNVPIFSILTESDPVWECFEEAKNKSPKRTLDASKEIIRMSFFKSHSMDDNYITQNKFFDFLNQFPSNAPIFFLFLLASIWTFTLEYSSFQKISPLMLIIILEFFGFIYKPYFKNNKFYIVVGIVKYILLTLIIIFFLKEIIIFFVN